MLNLHRDMGIQSPNEFLIARRAHTLEYDTIDIFDRIVPKFTFDYFIIPCHHDSTAIPFPLRPKCHDRVPAINIFTHAHTEFIHIAIVDTVPPLGMCT